MPKATFFNLADQKRKRFLHESYKEFSLHSYDAASISNLVKSLNIAKGSLYQYFDDKEDLYQYLVLEAHKKLLNIVDKTCGNKSEAFFVWYTKFLFVEVKFLLSFPHFATLFINLQAEIGIQQRTLAAEVDKLRLRRIARNLDAELYNSPINNLFLVRSPLLIFQMIVVGVDLPQLIYNDEPIYLEGKELLTICNEWCKKLERGL